MNAVTPFVAASELGAHTPDGALWAGRPRWASAAVHIWKAPWAAAWFALLLADGLRLALGTHAAPDAWTGEAKLLAISVVVTGGLLALAALTVRTTRYTIEPRAVVLRYGMALPATLVIPLAAIERVEVRVHRDGTGDVALRLKPGPGLIYPKLWPHARPWRWRRAEPMLRCVPEPGVAAARLCRMLAARDART
jgi:hypothetical protein